MTKRNHFPIRFGVILHPYSVSFNQILRATIQAEKLGFDSIWIPDHLQRENLPVVECWSVICALAVKTKRIRIGSLATCNSFRNPSLLARIISTASDISNGRIDVTIGLGYDKREHVANGYSFPEYSERFAMLSESVDILSSLWRSAKASYDGRYYKLDGAVAKPSPRGNLKLWVAGRNKEVFRLAARMGYGVSILPYSGVLDKRKLSSFEELGKICNMIDSFSGRRKHVPKSIFAGDGGLVIGANAEEYSTRLQKHAKSTRQSVDEAAKTLEGLSLLHGTTEECYASLQNISSLGFEELVIFVPGWQAGDYSNMSLFAKEFISS